MPKDTNNLNDEIKAEREKLKNKSFSEKLSYFIYYYKYHVLIGGIIGILVIIGIISVITRKDNAFYVCPINANDFIEGEIDITTDFAEYAGIDTAKADVTFETMYKMTLDENGQVTSGQSSYNTLTTILAQMSAGTLDGIIGNYGVIEHYGLQGYFVDLKDTLSPELYDRLLAEDKLLFVTDENSTTAAVGISLKDSSKLAESGIYDNTEDIYYAISNTCPHPETCIVFADYLLEQ